MGCSPKPNPFRRPPRFHTWITKLPPGGAVDVNEMTASFKEEMMPRQKKVLNTCNDLCLCVQLHQMGVISFFFKVDRISQQFKFGRFTCSDIPLS